MINKDMSNTPVIFVTNSEFLNENLLRKAQSSLEIASTLHYTPKEGDTVEDIIRNAIASNPNITEEQKTKVEEMLKLVESSEEDLPEDADIEMTDAEIDAYVESINDWEDIVDVYDADELAIIDDETGELEEEITESVELNEILSRAQRIKAKIRFKRTAVKRNRKLKLALKRRSTTPILKKRARRLAIKAMKVKLAKKPLNKMSIADKERVERIMARRKKLIDRMSVKLVPRVRQIEQSRLSHKRFTK